MTKQEAALASDLLDRAADTYSNHGCNDYLIPNTQENVDMLNQMEKWNVGHGQPPNLVWTFDPQVKQLYVMDWVLMRYLSARLQGVGGP